eukprot:2964270-Pleurochrysis_carterae.AAC.1
MLSTAHGACNFDWALLVRHPNLAVCGCQSFSSFVRNAAYAWPKHKTCARWLVRRCALHHRKGAPCKISMHCARAFMSASEHERAGRRCDECCT